MKLFRNVVLAGLALAVPAAASAQYQTWFDYTDHSHVSSGNVYVGPYEANLWVGGFASSPVSFDVYCVDGLHEVNKSKHAVWVTPVSNADSIATGRYTYSTIQDNYAKAAWLAMQFTDDNKNQWGAIHQSIWNIMTGGITIPGSYHTSANGADVDYWTNEADAGFGSVVRSEWAVLSQVRSADQLEQQTLPSNLAQEFLVRTHVTPEPGTWLMLLTGLVGVAGVAVRRRLV